MSDRDSDYVLRAMHLANHRQAASRCLNFLFTEWELSERSTFVKHLRELGTEEQGQVWQLLFHE